MRELGPSLRNASCKHCIPLGSTSNTYNLNSIAANSSHRSAIWRARHRSSLIRLARAHGSPMITWPQQVRTRVAMVHRETSSVNGHIFHFHPRCRRYRRPIEDTREWTSDLHRGCDDLRCCLLICIEVSARVYSGHCCAYFSLRGILDEEIMRIWNRIHAIYDTCLTIFNKYLYFLTYLPYYFASFRGNIRAFAFVNNRHIKNYFLKEEKQIKIISLIIY